MKREAEQEIHLLEEEVKKQEVSEVTPAIQPVEVNV